MESPPKETPTQQMTAPRFPGFKFSPTDEELITHYLRKKLEGCEKGVEVIAEVEICRYEPWDLPAKSVIHSENEWFFFSARGKKYPYGTQSRRATELGYWKATGKERNVKVGSRVIGTKRTLVFHKGRAPKGERTEWIMHEFCLVGKSQDSPVVCRVRRNTHFRSSDGMSRASMSQDQQLIAGGENHGASEGDEEIQGNLGDAFVTTTSSYGSYSIDSVRESNQKLMNDAAMTESSTHLKDTGYYEDVDDYLAYFLNDDPTLLDETAASNAQNPGPIESSRFEPFQLEPPQAACPDLTSYPGITRTTQIIWPHEPTNPPANSTAGTQEHHSDDKGKSSGFTFSPTCILSTMVRGKTRTRRLLSGAVVMALIAAAVAYCVGGLGRVKDLWT